MTKRFLSLITLLFIPLLLIGIIFTGKYFFTTPYDQFLQTTLDSIHRNDLKSVLQNTYFPSEKYHWVQIISLLVSGFSVILLLYFLRKLTHYYHAIESRWGRVSQVLKRQFILFKNITLLQKVVLSFMLILIVIRSMYYAREFYIQYDEAWNYNYFLQKNILFSFFAYNNYPLHNIITFIFLKIFPASTFMLRMPVILFGIAASLSIFIIFQKIFRESWLSILSVLLFASLPVSIYYMLYARGVMLNMFFLIWLVYYGWKMIRHPEHTSLFVFLILNVLGTMAILSHPVFIVTQWGTVFLLLLMKQVHIPFKQMSLTFVFSVVCSACVFVPFLLGSGISASTAGSTISIHYDIPYHSYAAFYGGWSGAFYILIALHIFFLFRKELKEYLYFIILDLFLLTSIPILYLLFKHYPPERALPYLFLPVMFGYGMWLRCMKQWNISWVWLGLPTLILSYFLNISTYRSKYMNWSKELDHQVFMLSEKIREQHIQTIFFTIKEFNYFVPGITYYTSLHAYPLTCYTDQPGSTRYFPDMKQRSQALVCDADTSIHQPILFQLDKMVMYLK